MPAMRRWNKEWVWGSAGENTDELHFNYHCVFSVDTCGDEGAHSKHRSLPSSQLDLPEPASCLRRNRTPTQGRLAFIHSSFKSCFIFAFDFFLMTPTVPWYSLTVCFCLTGLTVKQHIERTKAAVLWTICTSAARTINTGQPKDTGCSLGMRRHSFSTNYIFLSFWIKK